MKNRSLICIVGSIACLLTMGCIDSVREGFAGGVSGALENVTGDFIETIIEGFLDAK